MSLDQRTKIFPRNFAHSIVKTSMTSSLEDSAEVLLTTITTLPVMSVLLLLSSNWTSTSDNIRLTGSLYPHQGHHHCYNDLFCNQDYHYDTDAVIIICFIHSTAATHVSTGNIMYMAKSIIIIKISFFYWVLVLDWRYCPNSTYPSSG